jgi:short-subunit dehydrogenase
MRSTGSWKNRTAVISGGSNGLGRSLALTLAEQGANLVILGRDPERLKEVEKQALELGASGVSTLSIDLCDGSETEVALGQNQGESLRDILAVVGCDLLINAVGKSDRGLLGQLSQRDLLEQFELNVLSTHKMTKLCWSALCAKQGVVVNIASLAGIVSGPAMGGYSMAKHALVGLHRQWRLESESTGVHFLLVCPGPIAREDSSHRYEQLIQSRGLDPATQSPGGGVALSRLDPNDLSRQILKAAQERRLELVVPGKFRMLAMLAAVWPSLADKIIRKKMKRS